MVKINEIRKDSVRRRLLVMLTSLGAVGLSIGVSAEYADVVLNRLSDRNDVRPVIFPHWFHRIRFRCRVCHNELRFEMRAGANEITMDKIIDGQYCGLCHNNEIAWGVENCDLCHSGKSGLKTGIRGSNQTGGPGRW
jgi:c(7)-type cytochrome triheme protein